MPRSARGAIAWLIVVALTLGGCHLIGDYDDFEFAPLPRADKVDLLVVVDNSRGTIMADKQLLFRIAVERLVSQLLSRVDDLHVGVVTTSLGGHGSGECEGPQENDRGRLVTRAPGGGEVETHHDLGFLAFDPSDATAIADPAVLIERLEALVVGTGELGCGFEATLEAWYRFLVEPEPYGSLVIEDGEAVAVGRDEVILAQRSAFLRPDSLLIIVVLTDEDDCSIIDGGQAWLVAKRTNGDETFHLPPPRAACAIDPYDECCTSCGLEPPAGCAGGCADLLDNTTDWYDLRCFDQKRRFGIDFLYDVERYAIGLTAPTVTGRDGKLHDNPIFAGGRDPRFVLYAGIVGVPWQDLARRDASGTPDLRGGLDAEGNPVGGLMSAAELVERGVWDLVLGEPRGYYDATPKRPSDPLMITSIEPRKGEHPLTGDVLGGPGSFNAINGFEHSLERDLQYACIYELDAPKSCEDDDPNCVCKPSLAGETPLCRDPDAPTQHTIGTQYHAAAYPGLRHLGLMKSLGDQAVVGSICPAQGAQPADPWSYQASIDTLWEAIDPRVE